MENFHELTIGILGLGQMGGSIAGGLKAFSPSQNIYGFDLSSDLTVEAFGQRIVGHISESADELIKVSDILILAIPVSEVENIIRRKSEILKSKLLVTDTGSLKETIINLAEEVGLNNFIGGHPLAGTEKRGSAAWNPELFKDRLYFFTPIRDAPNATYKAMQYVITILGAKPILVDPRTHDRIFATTNSLPHLFAYTLKKLFDNIDQPDTDKNHFLCPSFLSATRVASSEPEMVFQMLWHNRKNLAQALEKLIDELTRVRFILDEADRDKFRKLFN